MKNVLNVQAQVLILVHCLSNLLVIKFTKAGEVFYITDWEGTLSTPDYPNTYPSNSNLIWIKSVSPGNRVKITIQDYKTQCNGDYLEIRDGDSIVSPLIEQLCGKLNSSQNEITSSGTNILLRFVSDNVNDTVMDRGFLLKHSGVCKVHINQTGGVIATPNYPNNYPNYMDCLWTIQLHPAMLIPLVCDNIAIEKDEGCLYDYMEILEGDGLSFTVIERHCGIFNRSVTVKRNGSLSIRFVSDRDKEYKGFRCSYNIAKGTSSVGTQLHSLILKTSLSLFSLETDVSSNSAKIDTLNLTPSNNGLSTVGVHSLQQTKSITTLRSPSSSGIDSRIFLMAQSAGLVTLFSQEIQASVSLSFPSRKDNKTSLTGESYGQSSDGINSLSTPTRQGLQSNVTVFIPLQTEKTTLSTMKYVKGAFFNNSNHRSGTVYSSSQTSYSRQAGQTPHVLETSLTAHIPSWEHRGTTLAKTTSSRNLSSKQLHPGVDLSSTPYRQFVTETHISFQGPRLSYPVSAVSSTNEGVTSLSNTKLLPSSHASLFGITLLSRPFNKTMNLTIDKIKPTPSDSSTAMSISQTDVTLNAKSSITDRSLGVDCPCQSSQVTYPQWTLCENIDVAESKLDEDLSLFRAFAWPSCSHRFRFLGTSSTPTRELINEALNGIAETSGKD